MNLQSQYDLAKEANVSDSIAEKAELFDRFPVREIEKRGWIEPWDEVEDLKNSLCHFWDSKSIDSLELSFSARKTNQNEAFNMAQMMWVQRAIKISKACVTDSFSKSKIQKHLSELHALTVAPSETRKVASVLAKMGIRFVVVKHLSKTKIDGAAIWIDSKTPLIALSLRYDRIDNFWHTLMHELAHVFYKDKTVVDVELEKSPDLEIENRANATSSNWLIPNELIESFARRMGNRISKSSVIQFSNLHNIHPGIVVGQLHHRKKLDFKKLRKFLESTRQIVVEHSISDGWD
jgi:HTH-type transcriptional regulator/antitoxin HigA